MGYQRRVHGIIDRNPLNNKIIILLSAVLILLFFSGCMTMGWGGHYNNGSSQPADQQANLIKEQQVANQTVRATFPSTEAGQQVHFELETISQDTTNTSIESVVLEIQ